MRFKVSSILNYFAKLLEPLGSPTFLITQTTPTMIKWLMTSMNCMTTPDKVIRLFETQIASSHLNSQCHDNQLTDNSVLVNYSAIIYDIQIGQPHLRVWIFDVSPRDDTANPILRIIFDIFKLNLQRWVWLFNSADMMMTWTLLHT